MNIMKARIVWFPERLSYMDFDSLQDKIDWDKRHLTNFTELCYIHFKEYKDKIIK